MKLPNNFGSICELKDTARRRPFIVKKSINGKQKALGYFSSYNEALEFLVYYNKEPKFYGNSITFEKLYSAFRDEHWSEISDAGRSGYENSYKHCSSLYKKPFKDIKLADFQQVIDGSKAGYSTQKKIRTLFHMMCKYAMKNDIIVKDYSQFITVCKDSKRKEKKPFTVRQIRKMYRSKVQGTEEILMLIYTGLRPSEFLRLKPSDINAKQHYLTVRQSKTIAGKNRIVPIHNCMKTAQLRTSFAKVMTELHMKHRPYECRHTFATLLDDNPKANRTTIKRLMGHALPDVLSKYYTHKSSSALKKCVSLLPSCY